MNHPAQPLGSRGPQRLFGPDATGLGLGGRRLSPFVGRDGELSVLLDRLRQVGDSERGQIVGVRGEAGAGKSRLLFELRQRLVDMSVPYVEGHCMSHAATVPFSMPRDLLRRAWHVDDGDSAAHLSATVHTRLAEVGLADGARYVLALFGLAGEDLAALSPEAVKARTFEVLRRLLLAPARAAPSVVLLEDLHWSDPISQDFLGILVDILPGARVLVVATSRPGYRAAWLERSWASQLALPSLSTQESLAVTRAVLGAVVVAEPVIDRIIAKADGNPFFLEELAWAVAGAPDAVEPLGVSDTITGALAARMDRLPAEPRRLLETAAVVGREVPLGMLETLSGFPADTLATPLRQLVEGEFLYEQPGQGVVFKHALTQDVAYARLSASERARLHTLAGEALERLHAGHLDGALAELAHHWARTTHHAKAAHYLGRFAARATAAYALEATLAALDAAEAHAQALPPGPERDVAAVELLVGRGLPLIQLGRLAELHDRLRSAQAIVARLGDHPATGPYHVLLSFALDHLGDRSAAAVARRALDVAERWDDPLTAGKAWFVLTLEAFWSGLFEEGIRHGQRGIALLEGSAESWWLGHQHWMLGVNAVACGRFALARQASRKTAEVGDRSGDPRLQSYACWLAGWVDALAGNHEAAVVTCRNAYDLAPDPLSRTVAGQWLGFAHLASGAPEAAIPLLREATEQYGIFNFSALQGWAGAWLSDALGEHGTLDEAMAAAGRAIEVSEAAGFAYAVGLGKRALGKAAYLMGDLEAAKQHLEGAFDILHRIEARPDAALTRLSLQSMSLRGGAGRVKEVEERVERERGEDDRAASE